MEDEILTPPPIGPFFRFPDEATGMAALEAAGLLQEDEDGNKSPILASHTHALDVIGPIQRGGEWDEDGTVITPPEVLPGWHFNYQGVVPDEWLQYAVTPENPVRIFF